MTLRKRLGVAVGVAIALELGAWTLMVLGRDARLASHAGSGLALLVILLAAFYLTGRSGVSRPVVSLVFFGLVCLTIQQAIRLTAMADLFPTLALFESGNPVYSSSTRVLNIVGIACLLGGLLYTVIELAEAKLRLSAQHEDLVRQMEQRQQAEETLRLIVEGTRSTNGLQFFEALVRAVSSAMHVRYVIVAEWSDDTRAALRTLAFWDGDRLESPRVFPVAGGPCAELAKGDPILLCSDARSQYPNSEMFSALDVEGYLGVPILTKEGTAIGHVIVMDDKPLPHNAFDMWMLSILAAQAGAELQRMRTEDARLKLATIVNSSSDAIVSIDLEGYFTSWNPGAEKLFGYGRDEVVGKHVSIFAETFEFSEGQKLVEFLSKGNRLEDFRLVRRHKDGRQLNLSVTISPIRSENGTMIGVSAIARDVSDRVEAIRALEESEQKLRSVFENVPDFVMLLDPDGTIRFANRSFPGFSADDLVGTSIFEYAKPEERARVRGYMKQVLESQEPVFYEIEGVGKDGITAVYETHLGVVRRHGEVRGIILVATDITERRRSAQALEEAEERYRLLAENTNDMIWTLDRGGRFTYASPSVERNLGYSADELLGEHFSKILESEGHETASRLFDIALAGKGRDEVFEVEHERKDGSRFWGEISSVILRDDDGTMRFIQGSTRDITERKRAEHALRSIMEGTSAALGEEFFRSLVRHLAEALGVRYAMVAMLDPDQHSAAALAFWAGDGYLGDFSFELAGTPSATVVQDRTCMVASDAHERFPDDPVLVTRGIASYFGMLLTDADERPLGLLAVMGEQPLEDVGLARSIMRIFAARAGAELERKKAEETRRGLEAQIQHAQKLESLGVLAGGIAHDFNNLLGGIVGYSSLARENLDPDSPIYGHVGQIQTIALRAADLTRQMLAYSGKGRFVLQYLNLSRVVEEMAELQRVSISKKAELIYEFPEQLPLMEGDATQVRQVIMNLITNASDAIGEAEGTITVRTGSLHASRTYLASTYLNEAHPVGEYVYFEVQDSGCGMSEETVSKIFDPFFTTKFTGRGLGLAAVLGIVRGHQGAVRVTSREGEGTTIRVLFPKAEVTAGLEYYSPEDVATAQDADYSLSGTVLVVDDEEIVRDVASDILTDAGFKVLSANDGRHAVEVFKSSQENIVAVVLDLTMPHMSGEEAFRELRRIRSDVHVILTSGYSEQEATNRFRDAQLDGFIQKPYDAHTLVNKVRDVIQAV